MNFFVRIISIALISIGLSLIFSHIEKNNAKEIIRNLTEEHIIIRLPKAYILIGYLEIAFCFAMILGGMFLPEIFKDFSVWAYIVWSLFALLGFIYVLGVYVWRIDIFRSEDYFLYRPFPFKTYKIYYSDCVSYKIEKNDLILKTNKRKIHIEIFATNFEFLPAMLVKHKVREQNTEEHIIIRQQKINIFIGYLVVAFVFAIIFLVDDDSSSVWPYIGFGLFTLLGIFLILDGHIFRIDIFKSEDYFLCRTVFFKTCKIHYSDCMSYKVGKNYLVLKTNKRKIFIDVSTTNFESLPAMLHKHKVNRIIK